MTLKMTSMIISAKKIRYNETVTDLSKEGTGCCIIRHLVPFVREDKRCLRTEMERGGIEVAAGNAWIIARD